MGPARYSCWQMLGLCTKCQRTPKAVQQVNNVFTQCQDIRSPINPGKAQTQWSTLDNRAACKIMPAATVDGAVVEQTDHLRYLGIHFNRVLTYRQHVETPGLKWKKGLSVLNAMTAKGVPVLDGPSEAALWLTHLLRCLDVRWWHVWTFLSSPPSSPMDLFTNKFSSLSSSKMEDPVMMLCLVFLWGLPVYYTC